MMFWEIIATVFAGFLFAGLVMPIRLFYKKMPKWIIPAMVGLGMICFQILSEYTWYPNTKDNLPDGAVVVATVPKTTWFRPWSYVKPQIFQFVVLDGKHVNEVATGIKQARLYFFERRLPAQELLAVFDCTNERQAYVPNEQHFDPNALDWQKFDYTADALNVVCH